MIDIFFQESRVLGSIGSEAQITAKMQISLFLLTSSLLLEKTPKKKYRTVLCIGFYVREYF